MKSLSFSFQRMLFIILVYFSAVSGFIGDITSEGNRTIFFAVLDALAILLGVMSIASVHRGLGLILLFLVGCIVFNFSYSPNPLFVSLNGVRDILLLLALPCFYSKVFDESNPEETAKYVEIMRRFAWFFLLAQLPVAGYQYLKYGATDDVGGTYGGYNGGDLTIMIVCMVFFLFQFEMSSWKKLLLYFTLIPLMLNETKISFILVPMMVGFIYFQPKVKNVLLGAGGAVLFLFLVNAFYSNGYHEGPGPENHITDIFNPDFLSDYLMSDFEQHQDVPRITKIILGYNIISQNTNTLLFGQEFGLFRGSVLGMSKFSQSWSWLLSGSRPYLFYLLMQGGLCLIAGFVTLILKINNFFKDTNKVCVFYFLILLLDLFYVDSFRLHNFSVNYFFLIFFANSAFFKNSISRNENSYRLA